MPLSVKMIPGSTTDGKIFVRHHPAWLPYAVRVNAGGDSSDPRDGLADRDSVPARNWHVVRCWQHQTTALTAPRLTAEMNLEDWKASLGCAPSFAFGDQILQQGKVLACQWARGQENEKGWQSADNPQQTPPTGRASRYLRQGADTRRVPSKHLHETSLEMRACYGELPTDRWSCSSWIWVGSSQSRLEKPPRSWFAPTSGLSLG